MSAKISHLPVLFRECPYCGGNDSQIIHTGNSIPSSSKASTAEFNLVSCRKCGTVYVNPAPYPQALMSYYPAEYYDPNINTYPKILDRFNKKRSFLHQQINEWLSQIDEGPEASEKSVFEVGCATGDNLEPFVHAGWNA